MDQADWLEQSCGPDMTLGSSPDLDITMALGFLTTFVSSDLPPSIGHEPFCLYLSAILHHLFAHHNGAQLLGMERHQAGALSLLPTQGKQSQASVGVCYQVLI